MLDYKKIGERILQCRKNKNMTQVELSEMLGISHQAVSKWEKGMSLPDIEQLLRLTKLFNLTMEQILLGHSEGLTDENVVKTEITSSDSSELVWSEVLKVIEKQINAQSYKTWFQTATGRLENETLIVCCPNPFSMEWLQTKYSFLIRQTLDALTGGANITLEFQSTTQVQVNSQ
ncbi:MULTISPECIES: helix-turn-helix domain-containing protein [Paenibacillus]|uniref:helix-turn-helix domain-containing protein n=1 Tax=Paenibacillus TaxID=44249 RepID=UPI00203DD5C2|nr:helix-turn-helix domain-containing protein [Paenibacillus camelliae]MCM3631815.1 helix-turn-helix domain-containing protein [Paenibacillus camelliae]